MDSKTLAKILSKNPETKNIFRGIFSPEQLLKNKIVSGGNKNLIVVLVKNHYLLIYISENLNLFLDPLDKNPRYYSDDIYNFLLQYGEYDDALFKVQRSNSNYSAYYVLAWSILLGKNNIVNVVTIFRDFDPHKLADNDKLVRKFTKFIG